MAGEKNNHDGMGRNENQSSRIVVEKNYTISQKRLIGLLGTALLFIATYSFNSIINSPHNRIDEIEKQIDNISDSVDAIENDAFSNRYDILTCQEHMEEQIEALSIHNEIARKHVSDVSMMINRIDKELTRNSEHDQSQDRMLTECVRRTGY